MTPHTLAAFRWIDPEAERQNGQRDVLKTLWKLTRDEHLSVRVTVHGLEITARNGETTYIAIMRWRELDAGGDPLELARFALRTLGLTPHREIRP